jgi:hypothetical protein
MQIRAIDLVTGEVTPDIRADSQRRELDQVFFYGNNGVGASLRPRAGDQRTATPAP